MARIKAQQIRVGDLWWKIEYNEPVTFSQAKKDAIGLIKNTIKMIEILVEAKIVRLNTDELEKLEADLTRLEKRIEVAKKELKKVLVLKELQKERESRGSVEGND